MERVNLEDVRSDLDALVERAERGEEIVIARGGRPVARLTAAEAGERAASGAVARAKALRDEVASRGESFTWEELKTMRDEGRP